MKATYFDVGNYLNSQTVIDLNLVGKPLIIGSIVAEEIREVTKMVMSFPGVDRSLVVNKSNRTALVDAFGNETDDWIGKSIRLHVGKVLFQGALVPSIAVEAITEVQASLPAGKGKKK